MKDRGFTLVEILFSLAILATVCLGLATGVTTGHRSAAALDRESRLVQQAQGYLERLFTVPFGAAAALPATGAELTELFDEDDDFGTATLHGLRAFGPIEFEPAEFPFRGMFRIVVAGDLNGDGDTADPFEGRADILRLAVFFEDRLLAETLRFDPTG